MSTSAGILTNPATNHEEEIWEGWSWPSFFAGVFWFMAQGMWTWVLISGVAGIFTAGISWAIFPIFSNNLRTEYLKKQGYQVAKD